MKIETSWIIRFYQTVVFTIAIQRNIGEDERNCCCLFRTERKTVDLNYFYFTSSVGSASVPSYPKPTSYITHSAIPSRRPLSSPPFFSLAGRPISGCCWRPGRGRRGLLIQLNDVLFGTEAEIVEGGKK